ncbi:hypothetical protein [Streptomyces sp. I05A-00742]|uniref:hypothetical protein n=1 Tax=Streptomyces sp. I05A-00742 TaxID=2732853 RepID=UPI001488940B|nr:hypothetical protein [Streptomyces sp. I05A-00742]
MNRRIVTRLAVGSILLASGGVATASATAHAAEGTRPAAHGVTERLSHLAATGDTMAGRAASWVQDNVPGEVTGQVSVETPLSRL